MYALHRVVDVAVDAERVTSLGDQRVVWLKQRAANVVFCRTGTERLFKNFLCVKFSGMTHVHIVSQFGETKGGMVQ